MEEGVVVALSCWANLPVASMKFVRAAEMPWRHRILLPSVVCPIQVGVPVTGLGCQCPLALHSLDGAFGPRKAGNRGGNVWLFPDLAGNCTRASLPFRFCAGNPSACCNRFLGW